MIFKGDSVSKVRHCAATKGMFMSDWLLRVGTKEAVVGVRRRNVSVGLDQP